MEPEGLLPFLQPVTGPHTEPDKSNLHSVTLFP
jgi:hypothetical protein